MYAEFQSEKPAPHALGTSATHRRHCPDVEAAPQPFSICEGSGPEGRFPFLRDTHNLFEGWNGAVRKKVAQGCLARTMRTSRELKRLPTVAPRE